MASNKGEEKGFAGLMGLISDVEDNDQELTQSSNLPNDEIEEAQETKAESTDRVTKKDEATNPPPQVPPYEPAKPSNAVNTKNSTTSPTSDGSSAIWWIVGVLVFLWVLGNTGNDKSNTEPTYTSSNQIGSSDTPSKSNNPVVRPQLTQSSSTNQNQNYIAKKYVRAINKCSEQIDVSFVFQDQNKLIAQGWWNINSGEYVNTNILTDSGKIFFYAYSKNYIWHGDDATGLPRKVLIGSFNDHGDANFFQNDPKSFVVSFSPLLMGEADDHYELNMVCGSKNDAKKSNNKKNNKHTGKPLKNLQNKSGNANSNDSLEVKNISSSNESVELARLNEEARRLAKIAADLQNKPNVTVIESDKKEISSTYSKNDVVLDKESTKEEIMKDKVKKALKEQERDREYLKMMENISKKY